MLLVYITCPNLEAAKSIAKDLIENRIAACVNIIPEILSFYHWENQLCEDKEVLILAKIPAENLEKLEARVLELHDYDCPCIVAFEPKYINPKFLNFINQS